jgi:hypothetical protein
VSDRPLVFSVAREVTRKENPPSQRQIIPDSGAWCILTRCRRFGKLSVGRGDGRAPPKAPDQEN